MKKGDTIYLKPTGNAARRSNEIKEAVIISIGRKYFQTENFGRFHIENLTQDANGYTPNYIAYANKQDILIELEADRICELIRRTFNYYSAPTKVLSIEKLRQIEIIINNPKT